MTVPVVSYMRQASILNPTSAQNTHVSVLGCGTVGSWAATCSAKAGFKKFFLCDMDHVEDVNLPSQAFDTKDVGLNKAKATADHISLFGDDVQVEVRDFALDGYEQFKSGVVIAAVDDMEMRRAIFENGVRGNREMLFIDFRMGGNVLKAWAFDADDERRCEQYEKTLHSSADSVSLPCGGRTFAPVGPLAGAVATQLITKWLREDDNPPYHVQMDFNRFASRAIGLKEEA